MIWAFLFHKFSNFPPPPRPAQQQQPPPRAQPQQPAYAAATYGSPQYGGQRQDVRGGDTENVSRILATYLGNKQGLKTR